MLTFTHSTHKRTNTRTHPRQLVEQRADRALLRVGGCKARRQRQQCIACGLVRRRVSSDVVHVVITHARTARTHQCCKRASLSVDVAHDSRAGEEASVGFPADYVQLFATTTRHMSTQTTHHTTHLVLAAAASIIALTTYGDPILVFVVTTPRLSRCLSTCASPSAQRNTTTNSNNDVQHHCC
jgi:hypothetical protein